MSTTVQVNGTVQFTYCNTCNLIVSPLKLQNGLKKHVRNVTRIKYGFVELVVILFSLKKLIDLNSKPSNMKPSSDTF